MLKLFFILYTGSGLIGGVAGPLPYGIEECEARRSGYQAKADAKPEISRGMRFACEWRSQRPEITEAAE